MLISPEQEALIGRVFETYLTEHHHGDLLQLMADTHEETHHPVVINAMTLFEANMEVGDYFNAYPNDVLAIFDKVLHRTATGLSENPSPKNHGGPRTTGPRTRRTLHARITGLPVCPELTRDTIPRSRDVGHFLSVTGTVIRTSVTKVLEYERDYMCGKCRHVFTAEADFEQFYTFVQPVVCPNPDGCKSYKFSCLSGSEPAACRDYQEIKIQEQVQRLSVGSLPRSLVVVLEDDLVDGCKSGDDVTVYGVMCQRWKPFYDGARCDVELVLKANNIEVNNQQAAAALLMKDVQKEFEDFWNSYKHDPIAGRNQILLSLCPQVFGMYVIKLAVAMVLAGGVQRIDSSGTKIRGECHMLLVGDPGTGKSQFLKYAAKIMPRSVLTAGIGSTSAGLTVAAVKDGGDWHLEAGALVLSDGGLCCIDEFNSIKEHDRISIHEAMEQQSISVAKAGMVCKLNTRTTILAATNPKGQYDPNEPLSVNVALASPLLSRFDLVLVLLDTRNAEWDRVISSFILEDRGLPAESSSLWSMDKMKAYFSVIKRLQPQVSEEADSILTRYYQLQRQSDGRNAARTTIRMLESLSRLAEAHARLMYRETATIEDAVMAVSVMECSMQGGALLGNVNALLTSFPADPGQQYRTRCQILLEGLNLPLLLQKEMDRLARLKSDASNGSQFDPPASSHQQELRDTDSVNTTHRHDVGSNCQGDVPVESGLDWFHSITPSLARGTASPMLASTQENLNRKPNSRGSEKSAVTKQPNCQAEEDILGGTSSTSNHAAVASASEEGNRRRKTNENVKGKSSVTQEDVRQAQSQEVKHPECLGYVFQKVSKKLRDRRLGELNHQQSAEEGGGTHGGRVVSADRETVVLVPTSSTLSSGKKCPSNDPVSSGTARRLEKEDTRDRTGTKSVSAVLREKMSADAETGKELHAKLSGFMFKPRKAIRSAHDPELSARSRAHSERGPAGRDRHAYAGGGNQKPVSHEDALTDTEKRQSKMSQNQSLSEGGGRRNGLRGSAASVCVSAEGLDGDGVSFDEWAQGKTVDGVKGSDDAETLCRRQRTNTGDESPVDSFTCNPPFKASTCADDPAPSKSGCTKSTVASSTLAKLSGFSFTRTTEPAAPAPTRGDKNPPPGVEKSPPRRDAAGCSRAGKKITAADGMGKVKDTLPPPVAAPHSGREPPTKTVSKCKAKQTEPADHSSGGPAAYQSTVNLKKRKCFELGPPPPRLGGSMGLFSGLSPFGSAELTTDVFDTDWDQELSKKAKN